MLVRPRLRLSFWTVIRAYYTRSGCKKILVLDDGIEIKLEIAICLPDTLLSFSFRPSLHCFNSPRIPCSLGYSCKTSRAAWSKNNWSCHSITILLNAMKEGTH